MKHFLISYFLVFSSIHLHAQSPNWIDVGPDFTRIGSHLFSITNIGDSMLIGLGDFIYLEDSNLANGVAVYKNGQWSGWPLLGQNYHPQSQVCIEPSDVISFENKIVFASTDYVEDTTGIPEPWGPFYQIRSWDGSDFDTLARVSNNSIRLAVIGNELYAHGWFSKINDQPCRGLAKYNGVDWECLDPPFGYGGPNVADICLFDNKLWVGGNFSNEASQPFNEIAYLDLTDSTWNDLDSGIKQDAFAGVGAFEIFKDELYIGGSFRYDMGNAGHHIMRWDGEKFKDVGGGVFGLNFAYSAWAGAPELKVFNDELWVGGSFDWAGGIYHPNLAIWNGKEWCTFGDEIEPGIKDIEVFQGELYILTNIINDDTINKVAKWTGGNYRDTCGTWTLEPHGIQSPNILTLEIFPNPTTGHLKISSTSTIEQLELLNFSGQQLINFQNSKNSSVDININHLPNGLYLLRLRTKEGIVTKKLIKSSD